MTAWEGWASYMLEMLCATGRYLECHTHLKYHASGVVIANATIGDIIAFNYDPIGTRPANVSSEVLFMHWMRVKASVVFVESRKTRK